MDKKNITLSFQLKLRHFRVFCYSSFFPYRFSFCLFHGALGKIAIPVTKPVKLETFHCACSWNSHRKNECLSRPKSQKKKKDRKSKWASFVRLWAQFAFIFSSLKEHCKHFQLLRGSEKKLIAQRSISKVASTSFYLKYFGHLLRKCHLARLENKKIFFMLLLFQR